jgi:hypothetical protein
MMERLNNELSAMHEKVEKTKGERHEKDSRSKKGVLPNFNIGDFVLVALEPTRSCDKLSVWWRGPYHVVGFISDWIYEVEDLIDGTRMEVHVTRLKLYCDSSLNISSVLTEAILHQKGAYEIDRIVDVRWNEFESRFEVHIEWRGFAKEESTWEPLSVIYADAPQADLRSSMNLKMLLAERHWPLFRRRGECRFLQNLFPYFSFFCDCPIFRSIASTEIKSLLLLSI